jgi:hypothetical protein
MTIEPPTAPAAIEPRRRASGASIFLTMMFMLRCPFIRVFVDEDRIRWIMELKGVQPLETMEPLSHGESDTFVIFLAL